MEMQRLDNFLKSTSTEFQTYLPIQLDGTCNGFQHLALLSNEIELFESLNLKDSNKNENPKDFYENLIVFININIEIKVNTLKYKIEKFEEDIFKIRKQVELLKSSEECDKLRLDQLSETHNKLFTDYNNLSDLYCSYNRVKTLKLKRNNIKSAIMTIPYNASLLSLIKYIKETLIFDHSEDIIKADDNGDPYTYTIG